MPINALSDLRQSEFDTITVTYPDSVTETYTHRKGGLSGAVSFVITLVYSDASKNTLVSATRTPQRT